MAKETTPKSSAGPPPAPPPPALRPAGAPGILGITLGTGKSLLMVGLVLVLIAKGCDSLATRAAARANARVTAARNDFEDEWRDKELGLDRRIEALTTEIKGLQKIPEPSEDDKKLLKDKEEEKAKTEKEKQDLPGERAKEQKKLTDGEWRSLQNAARDEITSNQRWAYWRGWLFVIGTIVLAVAVVAVGFQAEGAERWVCLLILAIIIYSIYISGAAWSAGPVAAMMP